LHAEAQPAWAIYTFAVGNRLPADATVDLALAEGATVWLAAADYELGRWQIAGPFGAAAGLPLGPANRSPGNTVAVAVLALPGSPATVEQVNLHTQNQLPEAALSLSVAAGDLPLAVTLTATGSDPDGGVASIKWDFEGDGTFDLITTDFAPVTHVYGQGGTLHPTVKVTDDEGGSSTAQQTLAVHGWTVVNVAPGGYASSSALIAGHPALAFVYRQTPGDVLRLAYAYSKSATGSQGSDWSVTDVDAFNSYLLDADLAEIDNSPAIAYSEDETCGLHYAYASGTGVGALRWHALTLDNSGQVGRMPSLAEVAHAPAIAYGPRVDGALRYMRAGTANGSQPSTWTTVVVDAGSTRVGGNASLAVVDGAPAIAYNDTYAGTLKYAHASTADGLNPADWSMLTLAASGAPSGYRWAASADVPPWPGTTAWRAG
jgi:hypothetical protein